MQELTGKRVLVLGAGISGRSAAAFCAQQGAQVVLADEQSDARPAGVPASVTLCLGQPFPDPADFDLVVPSPGIPPARYRTRARRVWGDIELAGRALAVPIAAVTGTNGKSTTVRLLEAMLRAAGLRARAAGNVGDAALGLVGEPLDVAVLEVSSFQLETIESFHPRVPLLTGGGGYPDKGHSGNAKLVRTQTTVFELVVGRNRHVFEQTELADGEG
jgi:UDP-N-acetylmuramoylalanine--D-glutamate ligase